MNSKPSSNVRWPLALCRTGGWTVLVIGVLALGEAGCTGVHQPATWQFGDVSYPPRVEEFVVAHVTRWIEVPSLGIAVTYVIPEDPVTELTLYVYPVSDSLLAHDLPSYRMVVKEYERALEELRMYANNFRELDEFELEKERDWLATLVDGSTLTGRSARVLMQWGDMRIRSLLVVFVLDETFIKFRFSYDSAATEKVLPQFERAVPRFLLGVERHRE